MQQSTPSVLSLLTVPRGNLLIFLVESLFPRLFIYWCSNIKYLQVCIVPIAELMVPPVIVERNLTQVQGI